MAQRPKNGHNKLFMLLNQKGFTLLEVMLVLLIVSMLAGTISIGVSQRNSLEFSAELNRLHRMLMQANDRALMRQELVGFFMSEKDSVISYGFKKMSADTGEWEGFRLPHWHDHELPPGIKMDIDNQDPSLSRSTNNALDEADLIFTPDGQYGAFELIIESEQMGTRAINGDGFAPVSVANAKNRDA